VLPEQVESASEPFLSQILSTLFEEEQTIRFSSRPKLALEMIFIKIFQIKPALSINTLIAKLDDLKTDILKTGDSGPLTSLSNQIETPQKDDRSPNNDIDPYLNKMQATEERTGLSAGAQSTEKKNFQNNPPDAYIDKAPQGPPETPSDINAALKYTKNEGLDTSWANIKKIFEKDHPPIGACLKKSALKKLSEESMELEVSGTNFDINRIRKDKSMVIIRKIFRNYFGKRIEIVIEAKPDVKVDLKEKNDKENKLRKDARSHPVVEEAIKVLNPKNVNINIL